MKTWIKKYALYLAWVVSLIGLICSLLFGEMLHYEPCRLCWYQRICLFPLVLLLGIGVYKDDARIASYTLPLAGLGSLVALYQVLGIFIPGLHSHALCGPLADCLRPVWELWGFLSFPLISFVGFTLLFIFLWLARPASRS